MAFSAACRAWDNAVVQSFFCRLKLEFVYTTDFATHEQAWLALFEYIEFFCIRQRMHSSLGYTSPVRLRPYRTS